MAPGVELLNDTCLVGVVWPPRASLPPETRMGENVRAHNGHVIFTQQLGVNTAHNYVHSNIF